MPSKQPQPQNVRAIRVSQSRSVPHVRAEQQQNLAGLGEPVLNPQSLTPANLLQLQRMVGNQAMAQLLGQETMSSQISVGTGAPVVQRTGAPDVRGKVWKTLNAEQRKVLERVAQGQNLSEVAVQLKLAPEIVKSHWETIITACQDAWALKPEEVVDENWIRQRFEGYMKLTSIELREMQPGSASDKYVPKSQDESLKTVDGHTLTWDRFDYTLVIERPDGTGAQLTYVFPKTNPGEQPQGTLTKVVPLSRRRVKALAEMGLKQGTFQETATEREARLKIKPTPTLCNAWPVNVGKVVSGAEAEDKIENEQDLEEAQKGTGLKDLKVGDTLNERSTMGKLVKNKENKLVEVGKTSDLNHLNPEGDAKRYGAWRTWADTPEGPKPGDLYSFWEAKVEWDKSIDPKEQVSANLEKAKITRLTSSNKHIGMFKSRRPNPDGKTETWTVTDGGQGTRQEVRERYRTFHIGTQIFTTKAADGGQKADARWMSGWLDLDAYYTNPETESTKADFEQWKKEGGKNATRQQGAAKIQGEQWPTEVKLTGTPPQAQADQTPGE